MSQVTVGGARYSVGRLDAFKQLHVARRIMPVFAANSAREYFEMLAGMSDGDIEYVVKACLGAVQREVDGGGWAPVMANGLPMYQDVDATAMMELAAAVIKENLSGFFTAVRAYAASGSTSTTTDPAGTA